VNEDMHHDWTDEELYPAHVRPEPTIYESQPWVAGARDLGGLLLVAVAFALWWGLTP